jgi:hypothetical protein
VKVRHLVRCMVLVILAGGLAARVQADEIGAVLTVSPANPTTNDAVVLGAKIDHDPSHPGTLPQFSLDRAANIFTITTEGVPICPIPGGPYAASFEVGNLPAGVYQVYLHVADKTTAFSFALSDLSSLGLAFLNGRFQVKLLHGATVSASAVSGGQPSPSVRISDQSGYFWFFGSASMELTVKLIDGRAVNGHFWLFAASMTIEPFVLEVIDTQGRCGAPPCVKLYANPAGTNRNFIDVEAFPD